MKNKEYYSLELKDYTLSATENELDKSISKYDDKKTFEELKSSNIFLESRYVVIRYFIHLHNSIKENNWRDIANYVDKIKAQGFNKDIISLVVSKVWDL